MVLSLHQLKKHAQKRPRKRLGRGNASGKGTYAGRGQKGQRARSGGRRGIVLRGVKHFLRQIPKTKGFKSIHPKYQVINLDQLNQHFSEGDRVDPVKIKSRGLVDKIWPGIKILGRGTLNKRLSVFAHAFSKSAKDAIVKKGGTAEIIKQ